MDIPLSIMVASSWSCTRRVGKTGIRTVCSGLLAFLAPASLHAQEVRAPWRTINLKKIAPPDISSLPAEACARLFVDAGPIPTPPNTQSLLRLVSNRVRRDDKGGIAVDKEGVGEHWIGVTPSKPTVTEWFSGGRFMDLQFFFRGREWWVASATQYEAKQGDVAVRLFDANANGGLLDETDYLAWRDGGLRPCASCMNLDDGTLAGTIRLVNRGKSVVLQFSESSRPDGLADQQWLAFQTANRMRNAHGFPPASIWKEACTALTAHTRFLQRHDPNKTGTLPTYYGEAEGLDLRTPEADVMSKSGNVAYLQGEQDAAFHISTVLNTTQSRAFLFARGAARFGYGRTGAWSFFRTDDAAAPWGSTYSLLPGPGTKNLPCSCGNNWPYPRSFPDLYNSPRGLPISIWLPGGGSGDGFQLRARSMALFVLPDNREVPGFFFSIRDVIPGAPDDMFFFVPGEPLRPATDYLAQVAVEGTKTAPGASGMSADAALLQWQFQTGK